MKKLLVNALAAACFAAAAGSAFAQDALRFNLWGSTTSGNALTWKAWVEEINEKAKGEFSIKLFTGGTLGRNPAQQHKLVRDGIIDFGWMPISNSPGDYPDAAYMELPFVVHNSLEGSLALWRLHEQGLVRGLDDVKVLAFGVIPPYGIHGTKAISDIASLKGMKIRVSGTAHSNFIDAIGGTPVGGIHFQSLAEALSRGVVDFSLAEWSGIRAFKLYEVAKHHMDLPLGGVATALLMRKSSYTGLSPRGQKIIDDTTGEPLSARWGKAFDKDNTDSRDIVLREDPEQVVHSASPETVAEFRSMAQAANEKWISENPERKLRYEALLKILAEVRAGR